MKLINSYFKEVKIKIKEIRVKAKKFYDDHEEEIGMCIGTTVIIAIAVVYYQLGSGITELRIGRGLYGLHKSNELHLYDPVRADLVYDLDEFHQIVKYARHH